MRKISFPVVLVMLFVSCRKQKTSADCINLTQNTSMTTVSFKSNYTIQFPADYEGSGMTGFEGNLFFKNKTNKTVAFSYIYCSPLHCEDFGRQLAQPTQDTIVTHVNNNPVILDKKLSFCDNNSPIAVFYFNEITNANGVLFWNENGIYKEALSISYNNTTQQEVVDIIRTIRRK